MIFRNGLVIRFSLIAVIAAVAAFFALLFESVFDFLAHIHEVNKK